MAFVFFFHNNHKFANNQTGRNPHGKDSYANPVPGTEVSWMKAANRCFAPDIVHQQIKCDGYVICNAGCKSRTSNAPMKSKNKDWIENNI